MVLIAIITGVYKPTYNWGAPPCGIRPCWGLPDPSKGEVDLPEDGILGEAWPAQLDPWNSWINHGSQIHQKPCDVSIYTSKKSTKNYQKRSKTIENDQNSFFKTRERPSCQLCPWESALQQINRPFPSCVAWSPGHQVATRLGKKGKPWSSCLKSFKPNEAQMS